ncbi:tryptophan synthase beta subunit-like PLP-dependent enzyme [Pisolithus orientalis]|uniref:tryptophan synthase beta subunit-like PLP-dependent enzyme n=1 Tax=Pisolithus orientalis TaxID=936130 RepID=UPI0022246CF8|nr:tryptophan synthase beta subunit-like PLP-dependent enzyme [Pisolithus orientalis]KAI5998944.1 tryptophan synthase beta subunit-like PLP-dependent enzyme [Pisolithus orientalis]
MPLGPFTSSFRIHLCTSVALRPEARVSTVIVTALTLVRGKPGVLHGVRTYVLQDPAVQIVEMYSISAGLDYPGVRPEHSWLKDSKRAEYIIAMHEEALRGFTLCTQLEGIIPALESSHALLEGIHRAKTLPKETNLVIRYGGMLYYMFAGPLAVLYNLCSKGVISICLSVSSLICTSSLTAPLDFEVKMVW